MLFLFRKSVVELCEHRVYKLAFLVAQEPRRKRSDDPPEQLLFTDVHHFESSASAVHRSMSPATENLTVTFAAMIALRSMLNSGEMWRSSIIGIDGVFMLRMASSMIEARMPSVICFNDF